MYTHFLLKDLVGRSAFLERRPALHPRVSCAESVKVGVIVQRLADLLKSSLQHLLYRDTADKKANASKREQTR